MAHVYQTRMVGQMPDSRDPLRAPPEIVYLVEEPARASKPRPSWAQKIWTLGCLAVIAFGLYKAALQTLGLPY